MDARLWLEALRTELVRRKFPRRYIKRLVLELSDHFTDFMEDSMSTDAQESQTIVDRLGMPSQVADRASVEYRHQRFSARHPWMAFVALPIVLLPLLCVGFFLGVIASAAIVYPWIRTDGTLVEHLPLWTLRLLFFGSAQLSIAICAAFFCRLAHKASLGWKWPMLACFVLAVVVMIGFPEIDLPTPDSQGRFIFGRVLTTKALHASQLFQFVLPLAIGGWAAWRQAKQRSGSLAS